MGPPCSATLPCALPTCMPSRVLFDTHQNLEHLALMERAIGPLPSWIGQGVSQEAAPFFHGDGRLRWPEMATSQASEQAVMRQPGIPQLLSRSSPEFLDLVMRYCSLFGCLCQVYLSLHCFAFSPFRSSTCIFLPASSRSSCCPPLALMQDVFACSCLLPPMAAAHGHAVPSGCWTMTKPSALLPPKLLSTLSCTRLARAPAGPCWKRSTDALPGAICYQAPPCMACPELVNADRISSLLPCF